MSSAAKAKSSRNPSRSSSTRKAPPRRLSHRSAPSYARPKFPVLINIYDLLSEITLASLLWPMGLSLLHTGVVLQTREYAYGATASDLHNQTGVFWTRPRLEPPGGTFRHAHLQGFTYLSAAEFDTVIREASAKIIGAEYDLLRTNCNHFTDYLCRVLTGHDMPPWINRAARMGVIFPCLVPSEWVNPPDVETVEGQLVGSERDDDSTEDERVGMLWSERQYERRKVHNSLRDETARGGKKNRASERNAAGRQLPKIEQAAEERLI